MLLAALANTMIALGWTVTKIRMGVEWMLVAYRAGANIARGVSDEVS